MHLIQKRLFSRFNDVCIIAAGRSAQCPYKGDLSSYSTPDLSSLVVKASLEKSHIDPALIQELILGNVYSANLGQSPAKQIIHLSGLKPSTVWSSVNKVCSSGLLAITSAYSSIKLSQYSVVAAVGTEIMSNVPRYILRTGSKPQSDPIDGLIKDGLWDSYYNIHMGECAEHIANTHNISREEMDEYSRLSHLKVEIATNASKFVEEIIPVPNLHKGGLVRKDVIKGSKLNFAGLKPAFVEGGRVTSGNASPITDGSAVVVLASRRKADEMGWKVLGTIEGFAHFEQDNKDFLTSPVGAVKEACARAGVGLAEVDFWELNEAFAVGSIACCKMLGLETGKVNVYGGDVALGHPLGSAGARIVVTMLSILRQEGGKIGVAAISNGGGGATAVVIKKEF